MDAIVTSGAVLAVSSIAAVTDARTGRIPNWLTLPAAVLGVGVHTVLGGRTGLLLSLGGLALSGLIPWALHRSTRGAAIGGGDVKLFAAIGALGGPVMGVEVELSALVLLSVFALLRLAFQGKLLRVVANGLRLLVNPVLPGRWRRAVAPETLTEMRMGPAIAAGALVVVARDQLARWLPWL